MWLCWDGNRLFQQWVLPLSLCCSIDSFLLAGRDTAVQRLIQKHLVFFFFLCQLISHAIMRDAETSLGPTDYRAPGSSAAAGQNMTSPSTNAMKGQTPPRGGLSCGRCRAVARSLETEARASQYNRTPPAERFFKNPQPNSALHWLCSSKCISVLVEHCCVREMTLKLLVAAEGAVWSQPSLSSLFCGLEKRKS